jgi:O-antigen biosynthesis protein
MPPTLLVRADLDTGEVEPALTADVLAGYGAIRVLALRSEVPVGSAEAALPLLLDDATDAVLRLASRATNGLPPRRGVEAPAGWEPAVSVIIATRDRPAALRRAVASILGGRYPNLEVCVVDNSAAGEWAETVAALSRRDPRVRYLSEPRPGISRARNHGARRAEGEILVFTDDDVVVSRGWLEAIVATLGRDPGAACVTGLILPAELETPAQLWATMVSGLNKGYRPRVFQLGRSDVPSLFPFRLGIYGSGANLGVPAEIFRVYAGFDEALGAGTRSRGGEDLDFFLRLILDGHRLVYEPTAYLFHHDYRRFEDLLRQRQGYGVGLAAVLTKHLMGSDPWPILRLAPQGLLYLLSPRSPKNSGKRPGYPRILDLAELGGLIYGPWAYRCGVRASMAIAGAATSGSGR